MRVAPKKSGARELFEVCTDGWLSGTLWAHPNPHVLSCVSIRPDPGKGCLKPPRPVSIFLEIQWPVPHIQAEWSFPTAGLIVLLNGLMDVGLEITGISPLRCCLIFKRHLPFLSCVSPLSWMSAWDRPAPLRRLS